MWIKVADQKPKPDAEYLVYGPTCLRTVAYYDGHWFYTKNGTYADYVVTQWWDGPIPDAPEEEADHD